ncbi:MAG: S8 family serine peptidase, partial [Anaerolineaceae bacterium]|nr:S8 family serine peptidase [Anaerolineaceae bacterium]
FDPLPKTVASPLQSKAAEGTDTTMLRDHVEELTSVSTIHKLGYSGKGVTIAIVDTGLNSSHEQYAGRVIAENCFSYSWHCKPIPGCVPCDENDEECDPEKCYDCDNNPISACIGGSVENYGETYSAFPGGAANLSEFDHGSHVAGISAGKDGMAPEAKIVAVQVQSEYYFPKNISDDNPDGYGVTLFNHDLYSAYDWLLEIQDELKKEGKPISILNLSLGGGQYADYCDNDDDCAEEYEYFRDLNAAGILPAAASGNEFLDDAVSSPGCLSNTLSVGALADMDTHYISCYSNHNPVVDILAPGSNIWSSYLVDPDGNPVTNSYGSMSGTSMATPVVSGALALIMEAFPGKTLEEYKTILVEMSTKTADRRNSNGWNFTTDDGTGTVFPFTKPVLDFSNFPAYYASHRARHIHFYEIENLENMMPKTGFSAVRPQSLSARPLSVQYKPTQMTIQIPTLELESDIVTVPFSGGEYPVEWLGDTVGLLEGSALPGKGITVLTGHNHLNTTAAGPFVFLSSLESNDRIMITDSEGNMQLYSVYENNKIPADAFASIADKLKNNTLVLITCEDESADGGYLNRRVIFASPD